MLRELTDSMIGKCPPHTLHFPEGTLFTVMFTFGSRQMASCYLLLYCTEHSEVLKVYTNQDVIHV